MADQDLVKTAKPGETEIPTKLNDVIPRLDRLWIYYPHLVKLNLLLFGALLTQVTNGYDGGMVNNMQLLVPWQEYFNHPSGARLGTMSNGVVIGTLIVTPFMSPMAEYFGRKVPILVGTVICVIGTILQGCATNFSMFVGARILIGVGTGLSCCVGEVYLTECAYPTQRPSYVGLLQAGYPMGTFLGALITWGPYNSHLKTSNWSWRIPSLLQGVFPLIQGFLFLIAPESPRWLVSKGKHEKARSFFVKYHGAGDENSDLVRYQMAEISATLEMEQSQNSSRWLHWFSSRAMIRRLCIIAGLAPMVQLCGNAIISYYLSILLTGIGITSAIEKLRINIGISVWGMACDIVAASFIYRTRRKFLFIFGFLAMSVVYAIFTILSSIIKQRNYKAQSLSTGAVVMIFAFQAFYHVVSPVAITYYMEITPFSLRAKASQIYITTGMAISFFNNYVNPIAMVKIGWKYYIVWTVWLVVMAAIVLLFFPETHGKSLEEVAEVFGDALVDTEEVMIREAHHQEKVAVHEIVEEVV